MDATYRSDLREVNELNFARFDAKVEQRFAEQDAKFERRFADFEVKVEKCKAPQRAQYIHASRIDSTSSSTPTGAFPSRFALRVRKSIDLTCSTITNPVTPSPAGMAT